MEKSDNIVGRRKYDGVPIHERVAILETNIGSMESSIGDLSNSIKTLNSRLEVISSKFSMAAGIFASILFVCQLIVIPIVISLVIKK